MKHKLSYYFSNEFYEKSRQEKLDKVKELLTQYDNEYNSYENISFSIHKFDSKTNNTIKNDRTFVIIFIIISFIISILIFFKIADIEINYFYFFSTAFIIAFIFIIYILASLKKEKKNDIDEINLNKDELKFIFKDKHKKTFNLKEINITSRRLSTKNNPNNRNCYIITIQDKKTLKKEYFNINSSQVENEFYAFMIFIKSINLSLDTNNLSSNQFDILYTNIFNNVLGLEKNKNIKLLLITGIALAIFSFYILFDIMTNTYTIIKYDKVEANITGFNEVRRYDHNGNRIRYKYIEISYEYNGEIHFDNIISDHDIFSLISKKKTIYVNQNNPIQYTYFRFENIILCLIISYFSYFFIKKYKSLK